MKGVAQFDRDVGIDELFWVCLFVALRQRHYADPRHTLATTTAAALIFSRIVLVRSGLPG